MRKQLITTLCLGVLSTMGLSADKILDRGPHLHFGSVDANGTTSVTRDLNLTNNGSEDLTITEIRFHEYGLGAYTTTGWNSGVIAPGASQLVPIKFDPDENEGTRDYHIAVYIESDKTNAGDRDRILFGEGTFISSLDCTRVLAFGEHLVFGDTTVGSSQVKTLTIKNNGSCDLTVTDLTYHERIEDVYSGYWTGVIPAYSSQDVNITYTPLELGIDSGLLYIESDRTNMSAERSRALIGMGI